MSGEAWACVALLFWGVFIGRFFSNMGPAKLCSGKGLPKRKRKKECPESWADREGEDRERKRKKRKKEKRKWKM